MNKTELVVCIIFLLVGIFTSGIGYVIKSTKCVEIISGYDSKLDDKDFLADLFGKNMLILGLVEVFSTIVYTIIVIYTENYNFPIYFTIANILMLFFICFKMYYRIQKNRK